MSLLQGQALPSQLLGTRVQAAEGEGNDDSPFTLPNPGACSGRRALTIAICDDSYSLTSPGGNDPVSLRYKEARIAFEHIAAACTCGQEYGAVVHFDQPSRSDVTPVLITGRGLRRLRRGLRSPRSAAGSSHLGPALQRATSMATTFAGEEMELVVFSDFLLMDQDVDAVFVELARFPGAVHAVVLAVRPVHQLLVAPAITVTEIGLNAQPGDVARALLGSLCEHRLRVPSPNGVAALGDRGAGNA